MKKLLILCATLFLVASGCHTTKTTTSSNHQLQVKDSTVANTLRQEVDSLTKENTRFRTFVFKKASELATLLQGSTGEEDTVCDIPIREKRLNIGDDYINVRGTFWIMKYTKPPGNPPTP